jgi:hypothetical protein
MLDTFIISEEMITFFQKSSFPEESKLQNLYFKEIVDIAKKNHIIGYSKKRKKSLIKLIIENIELDNYIDLLNNYLIENNCHDHKFNKIFDKLLENKVSLRY